MGISCGNADGIFVGEKCEHFFQLNVCIGFRVSSTFEHSRSVSDKSETMSGLSSGANARSLINIIKSRGLKLGDFCY